MEVKKQLKYKTIKKYESSIDILIKNNINFENFDDVKFQNFLDEKQYSTSTKLTYCLAVLWKYNDRTNITDIIRCKISEFAREKHKLKISKNNNLDNREINKIIKWENIIEIYKKLEELIETKVFEKFYKYFVILSFYIIHSPRRNEDLSELHYCIENMDCINDEECILWTNKHDPFLLFYNYGKVKKMDITDKKNYYVKHSNGNFFVFNYYKTNDTFGKQIIEVKHELAFILDKYIEKKNINNGDSIFNISDCNLSNRIQYLFNVLCGKKLSVNTLRHAFISNLFLNKISPSEKMYYSKLMAHGIETQMFYDRIIEYQNIDIEYYINIYKQKHEKDCEILKEKNKNSQKKWRDKKKLQLIK
jgi:hypothetical protein